MGFSMVYLILVCYYEIILLVKIYQIYDIKCNKIMDVISIINWITFLMISNEKLWLCVFYICCILISLIKN